LEKLRLTYLSVLLIFTIACKSISTDLNGLENQTLYYPTLPNNFPAFEMPEANVLTVERVELGKKLFNDNRLSRNETLSCASCHKANLAFSDTINVSAGTMPNRGVRNSPTLFNVAYHPYFFREGGNPNLEFQIQGPINDEEEFNFTFPELVERLKDDKKYENMAQKAYGRALDAFAITRAIAAYERTLISGNSRYDQYMNGNESALSNFEVEGMQLFFSDKLKCATCHSGFNFTNYQILNNGIYEKYEDLGLYRITGKDSDIGKFKTATLRNIALTAPYMFDGSFKTLEEVIDHYNSGGKNHANQNVLIQPLNLSKDEKQALKAFLLSLTEVKIDAYLEEE